MNRLKEIRENKGHTLAKVASALKTTPMTIQRFEAGTRNVSLKWLTKLANFYQIDVGELVSGVQIQDDENAKILLSELAGAAIQAIKTNKSSDAVLKAAQQKIASYFWEDVETGKPPSYEQVLRMARTLIGDRE